MDLELVVIFHSDAPDTSYAMEQFLAKNETQRIRYVAEQNRFSDHYGIIEIDSTNIDVAVQQYLEQ